MKIPPSADSASATNPPALSLANLSPANFGMVMATGIVSIAAHLLGYPRLAGTLFYVNCAAYAVLCALSLLRAALHPRHVLADLVSHSRGPSFFTLVAGSAVLGSQFVILHDNHRIALVLWIATVGLWVLLTYGIITILTTKRTKPPLATGINGAWLLMVVATQSIAVLGALLAPSLLPEQRLVMRFVVLALWLWGGMLYIWLMTLIFYRYTFFALEPHDLTPPYWINMGAMAISTLAGSLLTLDAPEAPFLLPLLPFIKGFTLFYWASGTWWIPMLLVLGVWRHGIRRLPLYYDPMYWGAVFPIGMYAVCTFDLIQALGLYFLQDLPILFGAAAIAAWALAFAGLLRRIARWARQITAHAP